MIGNKGIELERKLNTNSILKLVLIGLIFSHFPVSAEAAWWNFGSSPSPNKCSNSFGQLNSANKQETKTAVAIPNPRPITSAQSGASQNPIQSVTGASHQGFIDTDLSQQISDQHLMWALAVEGLQELMSRIPFNQSTFYSLITAVMAKQHIYLGGPHGAAKTAILKDVFKATLRNQFVSSEQKTQLVEDTKNLATEMKRVKDEISSAIRAPGFDQKKGLFILQCHQMMTRVPLIGGPDVFHQFKTNEARTDYQTAMIAEKNLLVLIDEFGNAPPAVQAILLSIMNERRAFIDNKVVQLMIETMAFTSNNTLAQFVADVEHPDERGGREALLSRMGIKVFSVNTGASPDDLLVVNKAMAEPGRDSANTVLPIRELRELMGRVRIPSEMERELVRIGIQMDIKEMDRRREADSKAKAEKTVSDYYPAWDGAIRSFVRLPDLFRAAFLVQQMMSGTPFESIRFDMKPIDLVNLGPSVLLNGPGSFRYHLGYVFPFIQYFSGMIPLSNRHKSSSDKDSALLVSIGHYQPDTGILTYTSNTTGRQVTAHFDPQTGRLTVSDLSEAPNVQGLMAATGLSKSEIHAELKDILAENSSDPLLADLIKKLAAKGAPAELSLTDTLQALDTLYRAKQKTLEADHHWEDDGRNTALLNASTLNLQSVAELKRINQANSDFLAELRLAIQRLRSNPLTYPELNRASSDPVRAALKRTGQQLAKSRDQIVEQGIPEEALLDFSWRSATNALKELTHYFVDSKSTVTAVFESAIAAQHLVLLGDPGGAKTMIPEVVFKKEVEHLDYMRKLPQLNAVLLKLLRTTLPEAYQRFEVWINQFHMFSTDNELVGRVDLKALEEGHGYHYDRSGSASAPNVLYKILDEFDKAPAGVKQSAQSLLAERAVMDGSSELTNLVSAVLTANTTPDEYVRLMGNPASAFASWDRLSTKVFVPNKATEDQLIELLAKGQPTEADPIISGPLSLFPLQILLGRIGISDSAERLAAEVLFKVIQTFQQRSNEEQAAFAEGTIDHFYVPSFSESYRTAGHTTNTRWKANFLVSQIASGQSLESTGALKGDFSLQTIHLQYLIQQLAGRTPYYHIEQDLSADVYQMKVVMSGRYGDLEHRLSERSRRLVADFHWEVTKAVDIANQVVREYLEKQAENVLEYPHLFPTDFVSEEARVRWLLGRGFSKEQIRQAGLASKK